MLRWENAGASTTVTPATEAVGTEGQEGYVPAQEAVVDDTYVNNGSKYTVFPLLIVGEDSFVNINFRGGKNNFRIYQQMPGQGAASADDPFGKHGWWSIQWWYGTMITRPDRLICIHTLAKQ